MDQGKMKMDAPLVIDSDNALGSPFGDIDDAYAYSTLMVGYLLLVVTLAVALGIASSLKQSSEKRQMRSSPTGPNFSAGYSSKGIS